MIVAWRLCKARHAGAAFSGEGARLAGGRWNSRGVPVVYLADSLALAALEQFVHIRAASSRIAFVSFRVEIPDAVKVTELDARKLPSNWRAEPAPGATMAIGDRWVKEGSTAVLKAPSVIVPEEFNFVLNPLHPHFGKIRIRPPKPFSFDPRMWK